MKNEGLKLLLRLARFRRKLEPWEPPENNFTDKAVLMFMVVNEKRMKGYGKNIRNDNSSNDRLRYNCGDGVTDRMHDHRIGIVPRPHGS